MNTKTFSLSCSPPRATKQKPNPKNKMTKRHSRPTKAQNRWTLVSNEMLTFNEVVKTSVTADSNVPQTKQKLPSRLNDPDVVAKRLAKQQEYWRKRRTAKEAAKRYIKKYNLKCISARIPASIVNGFNEMCGKHNICRAEVIARLLNGFIQRNSYPKTK
jgi:hypothetical protein